MLKDMNNWPLEDGFVSTQVLATEKQSLVQRYLQNPFSLIWSRLATLFQVALAPTQPESLENHQSEQYQPDPIRVQVLDPCFTDRVDPSLYYTVFFTEAVVTEQSLEKLKPQKRSLKESRPYWWM